LELLGPLHSGFLKNSTFSYIAYGRDPIPAMWPLIHDLSAAAESKSPQQADPLAHSFPARGFIHCLK
jgi:hypothetical protein